MVVKAGCCELLCTPCCYGVPGVLCCPVLCNTEECRWALAHAHQQEDGLATCVSPPLQLLCSVALLFASLASSPIPRDYSGVSKVG